MLKKLKSPNGSTYLYDLNSQVGRGASAEVFLGRIQDTDQQVAIKTIYKPRFDKLLWKMEAHALRELRNTPNVIHLIDFFQTGDHVYLITEYCELGDLRKLLNSIPNSRLEEYHAVGILKSLVEGLSSIHQKGFIHRDLKPENIFLFPDQVKIADFGIAVRQSTSNEYIGTLDYMSPEIHEANESNAYGNQVDVWALGVIFHELLLGTNLSQGKKVHPKELFQQDFQVQEGLVSISMEAKDLLEKMLKINPAERIEIEKIKEHSLFTQFEKEIFERSMGSMATPSNKKEKLDLMSLIESFVVFSLEERSQLK